MVNSKAWAGREAKINRVISNFKRAGMDDIKNTYGYSDRPGENTLALYYHEMKHSKFIMSPKGMGLDCYRNWDAFYAGTIPVIEREQPHDNWADGTLADLPVVLVDTYNNVTPALLEAEFERIVQNADNFKYEKLTRQYWINLVKSIVANYTATRGATTTSRRGRY